MSKRDFYDILGVPRTSDEAAIKSAYRKLAMQYHPDRNPGDKAAEEKFKEATEAYEVLKDADKRRTYDQYGHAAFSQGAGGQGGFGGAGYHGFDMGDALRAFMRDFGGGGGGSIFEDFFGGGGRSNRGEDLRLQIRLTLEEIANGVEKKVKVNRQVRCETCDGSGVAAGSSRRTCTTCKGHGQVRSVTKTFLGTIQQVTTCHTCRGTGEVIADPCKTCSGEGRHAGSSTVTLKIPAGVATGNYMSVEGMGNAARHNGATGDLVAVFEELEHEKFTREGEHIIYETAIPFPMAALGGEVNVPTLEGNTTLKIPSGTQSGKFLKLKGKGIPRLHHSGRGDQLVRVVVWVPTSLTSSERKSLETLLHSENFKTTQRDKSFFSKLRETLGV